MAELPAPKKVCPGVVSQIIIVIGILYLALSVGLRSLLHWAGELDFARKVSDRVIFMHLGRVYKRGFPSELFGSPQTPELQQFLSSLHD